MKTAVTSILNKNARSLASIRIITSPSSPNLSTPSAATSGHLRRLQTFRFSEEVDDDNSEEQYADADDDDDIADDRGNKDGDGRRRLLQKTVPECR